jgi:hypothetical protein
MQRLSVRRGFTGVVEMRAAGQRPATSSGTGAVSRVFLGGKSGHPPVGVAAGEVVDVAPVSAPSFAQGILILDLLSDLAPDIVGQRTGNLHILCAVRNCENGAWGQPNSTFASRAHCLLRTVRGITISRRKTVMYILGKRLVCPLPIGRIK